MRLKCLLHPLLSMHWDNLDSSFIYPSWVRLKVGIFKLDFSWIAKLQPTRRFHMHYVGRDGTFALNYQCNCFLRCKKKIIWFKKDFYQNCQNNLKARFRFIFFTPGLDWSSKYSKSFLFQCFRSHTLFYVVAFCLFCILRSGPTNRPVIALSLWIFFVKLGAS